MRRGTKQPQKKSRRVSKVLFRSLLLLLARYQASFVLVIVAALFCFGLYYSYVIVHARITTPSTVSDRVILERVGKLIVLPTDPLISIKRVEDAEKLRLQNKFFSEVDKGDYIIAYDTMLVIYDVLGNKIVSVKSSAKQ